MYSLKYIFCRLKIYIHFAHLFVGIFLKGFVNETSKTQINLELKKGFLNPLKLNFIAANESKVSQPEVTLSQDNQSDCSGTLSVCSTTQEEVHNPTFLHED